MDEDSALMAIRPPTEDEIRPFTAQEWVALNWPVPDTADDLFARLGMEPPFAAGHDGMRVWDYDAE